MAKISLNYSPIESDAINALDSAISTLNTVIESLQQNSIPGDFYRRTTLANTISDLKAQRDSLTNLKDWLVNSNKNYDSFISRLELQAYKLPVYQVRRKSNYI